MKACVVVPYQPRLPRPPPSLKRDSEGRPTKTKTNPQAEDPDPDFVPVELGSSEEEEEVVFEKQSRTKDLETTGSEDPASVLPFVYKRFKPYFQCLKPVSNDSIEPFLQDIPSHQSQSNLRFSVRFLSNRVEQFNWGNTRPLKVSKIGEDFYRSVEIQAHTIKIGSVVRVDRNADDELSYRKSRLTTVDPHYGSDTEEDDEEEIHNEDDDHPSHQQRNSAVGQTSSRFNSKLSSRPNLRRFIVRALFERDNIKYFHGTWLEEASRSFVGAAAEPLELLLVDQCYEIELKFITGIEHVVWITSADTRPPPTDSLYCRFHWKPTQASLLDLPRVPRPNPPNPIDDSKSLCSSCVAVPPEIEWLTDPSSGEILLGSTDQYECLGFVLHGEVTYRLNDFVRVSASSPSLPQQIGQIVEICGIRANPNAQNTIVIDDVPFRPPPEIYSKLATVKPVITIRLYRRSAWYGTSKNFPSFKDDRRLWISAEESLVDVRTQLQGKCEIVHLIRRRQPDGFVTLGTHRKVSEDSIVERDNCFYSVLPTIQQQQEFCSVPIMDQSWKDSLVSREPEWVRIEDEKQQETFQELLKNYGLGQLRHLELFGGIGSMSVALMEVGLSSQDDTMFIDLSIPACQTVAQNFPRSRVICADVNEVFELMINGKLPNERDFLIDRRTGRKIDLKDLPRPGDFDLITAGFPCGSHSTLNVLRKANDSKNALCATALSFIGYLRPDYLFLENVRLHGTWLGQNQFC